MKNLIKDTTVIIRTTGERTEDLCKYAVLKNGINENQIFLIKNISPFSQALKKGFELALEVNKKYTFFIDADLILLQDSLSIMLTAMERLPQNTFFLNPLCYDYITNCIVPGGPHLYKTEHLQAAFKFIPGEQISLRPETYTEKMMRKLGYFSIYLDIPVALHDFEQYYRSIFKSVCSKVNKFPREIVDSLGNQFLNLKDINKDFFVANLALEYCKKNKILLKLDYTQFNNTFKQYNIVEKDIIHNVEKVYYDLISKISQEKNKYEYKGYTGKIEKSEQQDKKNKSRYKKILKRFKLLLQ